MTPSDPLSLAEHPIPALSDPDWAAIANLPIVEQGGRLHPTSLGRAGMATWPIYHALGVPGAVAECFVREPVYRGLLAAANMLPEGVGLVVLDGWRPMAVQRALFERLHTLMAERFPEYSNDRLYQKTRAFVAPPSDDPAAPSPHLTGGAVDVALCDECGLILDMGSAFDEVCSASYTDHFETHLDAEDAMLYRARRRVLFHAMASAGFVNLPSEWWHYSLGDQLWAWRTGSRAAQFGPTSPYTIEQR
ncbi:M15 family metallopeptidase [Larsenimonas salina]|uniref:M15 family metallopeptidase n=1 Tax=Larsenimonas salina TaxID=1295565 RepID=UPI0020732AFD|nr:M15 family metallopeptidase [Larsenimonas salina]